jgi:hypothetical protein
MSKKYSLKASDDIMKTQKLFFINYTLSLSKDNEAARRRLRRRI